jgi:aspartate racemase
MHKVAGRIEEAISIPFLHITDATGVKIREKGVSTVGLLGTAFTMEQGFYPERLLEKSGIGAIVPGEEERQFIHQTIYTELCCGVFSERARERFLAIIDGLVTRGAEGVVLGCTEIPLLVTPDHTEVPLFDTGRIHTEAAVEKMLG